MVGCPVGIVRERCFGANVDGSRVRDVDGDWRIWAATDVSGCNGSNLPKRETFHPMDQWDPFAEPDHRDHGSVDSCDCVQANVAFKRGHYTYRRNHSFIYIQNSISVNQWRSTCLFQGKLFNGCYRIWLSSNNSALMVFFDLYVSNIWNRYRLVVHF